MPPAEPGKEVKMPERTRKHLDYDDRCVIEEKVKEGRSARSIAELIEVSPSTVTREVKANRTMRPCRRKEVRPARKCANYEVCRRKRDACDVCTQGGGRSACRLCRVVTCCEVCDEFSPRVCLRLDSWPYVCDGCERRGGCDLPKARYDAKRAGEASADRRSESRRGISVDEEQLSAMVSVIAPLLKQGLSLDSIWMAHPGEFPVGVRTFYGWIEDGTVDIAALDLPRKARFRPRKRRKVAVGDRVDRTGRTYEDFLALPDEDRARAVQGDSVIGLASNSQRILSIHFPRMIFQIYVLLADGRSGRVVAALDAIEAYVGDREAFEAVMGIMVVDRGTEFDDFEGMERSALEPGERRCRVYYCDPMRPGQKAGCERNHSELRRILPKGRSDFDKLDATDVAVACSHVNSYPRRSLGGACPAEVARITLPASLLDSLGIERVPPDDVVLRPTLIAHAVEQ